jgi:hypothetical protein
VDLGTKITYILIYIFLPSTENYENILYAHAAHHDGHVDTKHDQIRGRIDGEKLKKFMKLFYENSFFYEIYPKTVF